MVYVSFVTIQKQQSMLLICRRCSEKSKLIVDGLRNLGIVDEDKNNLLAV